MSLLFRIFYRDKAEFAGKNNLWDLDTETVMQHIVAGMVGRRLMYKDLIANPQEVPNGE